jgi:hypothetical protein
MKNLSLYCILMILTLSVNSSLNVAFAGLIDRGNGMIYDDVQDITWLQDANLAGKNMTWYESMAWAENLEYGGFDNWRLFSADQYDTGCSQITGSGSYGYGCTGNELGNLFYQFGLTEKDRITDVADNNAEFEMFTNIQAGGYWTSTELDSNKDYAFRFGFDSSQGNMSKDYDGYFAWAVLDGDVAEMQATVPEPSTMAIFGLGLLGLICRKRKNK